MDRLNHILVIVAIILCFLVAMVLRQPVTRELSNAHIENPLDHWFPGSPQSPEAVAPSGTDDATPSPSAGARSDTANPGGNGTPGPPPPSYPVFPTLAPIVSPRPTPTSGSTPAPGLSASFGFNPSSPLTGQVVSFDGRASRCGAGPCTYKWTDDACPSPCGDLGTGPTLAFTFANAGTKFVRLTLTDALAQTATVEHNVTVAAPVISPTPTPTPGPTAAFGYSPLSPLIGQVVSFDSAASRCAAGPCTYKWTDDACPSPCGDLGTGPTLIFVFANAGTKFVRLTVTDALGRTASVEHNVVVS